MIVFNPMLPAQVAASVSANLAAKRRKQREAMCQCGDRKAADCPGEWEPGCDLGNNEAYCKKAED